MAQTTLRSKLTTWLTSFFPGSIDLVFAVAALGFGFGLWQMHRATVATIAQQTTALRADSLTAALDTTRHVNGVLSANLNLVTRRSVQQKQRADSLDNALGQVTHQRDVLTFKVADLNVRVSSPVTADSADSVRHATFTDRQAPFTTSVAVSLPRAPAMGVADVNVRLDTAHVGVRTTCGKVAVQGIFPASTFIDSPKWLNVKVDTATQDANICNSQIEHPSSNIWTYIKVGGSLIAGLWIGHKL